MSSILSTHPNLYVLQNCVMLHYNVKPIKSSGLMVGFALGSMYKHPLMDLAFGPKLKVWFLKLDRITFELGLKQFDMTVEPH